MKDINEINMELMMIMEDEIETLIVKQKILIEIIRKHLPQYDRWLDANFKGE